MRLPLRLSMVALSAASCVSSSERTLDIAADSSSDAEDVIGEDVGPDGTSTDGSPGETSATCDGDEDCVAATPLGNCEAVRCIDGACGIGVARDGTACEDGDPCTGGDTCASGGCTRGRPLDCGALGPCWELTGDPVCDPIAGCPATPLRAGVACGAATDLPSCDGGWSIPPPTCDGAGMCVDHAAEVPPGIHPLAGSWYFVTSTAAQGLFPHTARALLNLGGTLGTWTATNVAATSPDLLGWLDTSEAIGDYCAGLAGDVTLTKGTRAWDGFVDESANVMVLAGAEGDELTVAVRAALDAPKLDGDYAFIGTAYGPAAEMTPSYITYHGVLRLKDGCVESGSEIGSAPGAGSKLELEHGSQYCFAMDDGLLRLDGEARADGASELTKFRLAGVPALGGDLVLLTREGASGLEYGTILLVRKGSNVSRSLEGRWRFVSQRGGLGPLGMGAIAQEVEDGWLRLGPEHAISGEVFGFALVSDILGGWWDSSDAPALYSQRASFGDVLMHHTGNVASGATFVAAMSTAAPSDPTTPTVLPPIVGEGSLFVMVRPASFAPGWVDD